MLDLYCLSNEPNLIKEDSKNESSNNYRKFAIDTFVKEMKDNSITSNKSRYSTTRFNAYDIASNCIRNVLFRIYKTPLNSYEDTWLPVKLRTTIGSACHDFLQSSKIFTEKEVYLRIPSKNISVKIDGLIDKNVLVEIKTCAYDDFDEIHRTNAPRIKDMYQAFLYRHLLENYLEESISQDVSDKQYNIPKHEKYDIKAIQFIYICNELLSMHDTSIEDDVKFSREIKKKYSSKRNPFWFIKVITVENLDNYSSITNHLVDKLNSLNEFFNKNMMPNMQNKYVDKSGCFFCLYKDVCKKYN